ncbi:MAG: hypothetical protein JO210_02470 [Acidobacteriaceae bacterium]|nr:hypothetical protein [Acidobacteriaceae bacterium]
MFLSPDEHSVILLWPNQNGTGSKPVKMPLHNVIQPDLRVRIDRASNAFVYSYHLENGKRSEDWNLMTQKISSGGRPAE